MNELLVCRVCHADTPARFMYGETCAACALDGVQALTIEAGDELPLEEVFSAEEIGRLVFLRHLVQSGQVSEWTV